MIALGLSSALNIIYGTCVRMLYGAQKRDTKTVQLRASCRLRTTDLARKLLNPIAHVIQTHARTTTRGARVASKLNNLNVRMRMCANNPSVSVSSALRKNDATQTQAPERIRRPVRAPPRATDSHMCVHNLDRNLLVFYNIHDASERARALCGVARRTANNS